MNTNLDTATAGTSALAAAVANDKAALIKLLLIINQCSRERGHTEAFTAVGTTGRRRSPMEIRHVSQ